MAQALDEPGSELSADFALMNVVPGSLQRFHRLRIDTNAYIDLLKDERDLRWATWPSVEDANHLKAHFFDKVPAKLLDPKLASRWIEWGQEYEEILRKSPRWRLKLLVSEICEIQSGRSWPEGTERDYWYWAMMPDGNERIPFNIREDLIDQYRDQMRSLIVECDGFLYVSEENGWVAFASAQNLSDVWRRQKQLLPWERIENWRKIYQAAERARYDPAKERFALVGLFRLIARWLARKIFD